MRRALLLMAFAIGVLLLLIPDFADGRGRRRPGVGGGPAPEGGGGSGDTGDSGSGGANRAPPSDEGGAGPSGGIEGKESAAAPKDPANAIQDELRLHVRLAFRQCGEKRSRDLLWRTFEAGRLRANLLAGLCPQCEHPGEDEAVAEKPKDESPEQDPPPKDKPSGADGE